MRINRVENDCPKDLQLKSACEDFEALFLKIIWKEMRKSTGGSFGEYDGMIEEVMGDALAKGGGLGLAKVIYDRVSNHPSMT